MTGDVCAQGWPGAWRSKRCGPPNWLFTGSARRGRPPIEGLDDLIAFGRMWKGAPFGGPGWGPHRPRGGRARRGDVRLALLRLLGEGPRNGYQLMQAIEERSEGLWRPSPGSVYPTLAQLEDEGLIRSVEVEGARRFEITEEGREHLAGRAGEQDPWEPATGKSDNPLSDFAPLVIQIGKATFQVASVGDQAQREQAQALLADTRRALYRILAEDTGVGDDEPEEEGPR